MKYDITVVKKIELKKKSTSLIDKKRSVYLIMLNNSYKVKKKIGSQADLFDNNVCICGAFILKLGY